MTGKESQPVVGFIGLGIMGRPMAVNLIRAGYALVVQNRSQAGVDALVALGATRAGSPAEVARAADIVITMLPDSPDVEQVVAGPDGLLAATRPGHLVIDMSTINPLVSRRLGEQLADRGGSMMDAPVSGGEEGAVQGILSIMVGGTESDFARARPVLGVLGKTITHMGPLGSGGFTKLANQIIVAINLAAIGEALSFGTRAGVDPAKMIQALGGGMAGSRCLELKKDKILSGDFAPGFKIDLHAKDLRLVHSAAASLEAPVPTTALVEQFFAAVRRDGAGGDDHSGIVRFFERLNRVEVRTGDEGTRQE